MDCWQLLQGALRSACCTPRQSRRLTACKLGAVTALLNDLAALVSRRARRRQKERMSGINEGAADRAVAADSDADDAVGDVEEQKVCCPARDGHRVIA